MALFTGSPELAGLYASSILAVWWPTAEYYLHHCHMPQCWTVSWLSASSLTLGDFLLHISSPPLSLSSSHSLLKSLSHIHTVKQGLVTTQSADVCLSVSSHSLSYCVTTHSTAVPLKHHSPWWWKCINHLGLVFGYHLKNSGRHAVFCLIIMS